MALFIILGIVVLVTVIVLAALFFMLSKEGQKVQEEAVPVTNIDQLKKDLSTQLFEPNTNKVVERDSEIIPVYQAAVSLPKEEIQISDDIIIQDPPKEDPYKKRANELEDELRDILKKADGQSVQAQGMIDALRKENESLKNQQASLQQAQTKLEELQGEAEVLKTENISLQTQLGSTHAKIHLLEEELAAVKIQMGEEIAQANETVDQLNQEKEALLALPKPEPDKELRQELDTLKSEYNDLNQKIADLERTQEKLRELNSHLMEKNDLLQYELIKARAQSSGLERVSFNYKHQLEDFFNKMKSIQVSHDQLSQVKNRLEGVVQEVQSQNEELVKKDQLTQFELERNRSRLVNLQKEYEELKARVQQNNQQ